MKTSLLALGLMAALPFAASAADGLSYNYVEGGYVKTDADGGDADGWALKGSYALSPNFSLFGDFNRKEPDGTSDFHVNQWRVGAGYNLPIAASTDFVARVAYQRFDPSKGDLDFNGYSGEAGIRNAFGQHFEVYALAGYEDYSKKHGINPDGEWYGRLGVQAKLNPNWGLSGEMKMVRGGDKEWFVGPRFSW